MSHHLFIFSMLWLTRGVIHCPIQDISEKPWIKFLSWITCMLSPNTYWCICKCGEYSEPATHIYWQASHYLILRIWWQQRNQWYANVFFQKGSISLHLKIGNVGNNSRNMIMFGISIINQSSQGFIVFPVRGESKFEIRTVSVQWTLRFDPPPTPRP